MDPIPLFSTLLSKSLLLCSTIDPIIIPFYSHSHHHHRMIPSLPRPPSLPLQPTFHPPKIISSAVLGGGNGRRRGKRRRRKTLGSAGMSALRQAFSFAASSRRLWPPAEPLDMLILFQNGGGGGGRRRGWRGFWSGGEGWPERRMPWKEGGLVGLLISLAVTAAASVLGRTGEKDLGIGALVPGLLGLKRRRIWRGEVGVLILGFALCLLFWKAVGRRRRNGRRWIASFAWRF